MGKRKVTALEKVEVDFVTIQLKIRSDPQAYEQEFDNQYQQYLSQREIFLGDHAADANNVKYFHDLVDLIAHVADCYRAKVVDFPGDLKAILQRNHAVLGSVLREKIVGSLGLLCRKNVIDTTELLTTLFPVLVSSPSKTLRASLLSQILSHIRAANVKSTNHKLNHTLQDVLRNLLLSDKTSAKGLWAVKITRDLWKRQVWTDAKPVDVMQQACLADNEKVVVGGVRFFLGGDKEREELDDEDSEEEVDLGRLGHQMGINKKTRKKAREYKQAVAKVKKQERKKNKPHPLNFSAFHLLYDADDFAQKLFHKHLDTTRNTLTLESKLLVLQLVTRLVGLHKLILLPLYSWFMRFLTPQQRLVTSFLASLAQGIHKLVPPDEIEPLIAKIAKEFVSEESASEVAAAGLNAIREICVRQPLAMNDTLLNDLVEYRKSKDKGVVMAAKGLLSLYRDVDAKMLRKRDRGKKATIALISGDTQQIKYGEEPVGSIEGLDLLQKWKEEERKRKRVGKGLDADAANAENLDADVAESDDGWEVASLDSSDSEGWIDVSSESEAEVPPPAKKIKRDEYTDTKQGQTGNGERDDSPSEAEDKTARSLPNLATTTILTPADLQKLKDLRMEASLHNALNGNHQLSKSKKRAEAIERHADDELTAEQIEMPAKLRKMTKEERIQLANENKPNREEHKSTQAIRKAKKEAAGKSTSNREKQRNKNMIMTLGKAKSKQKRSLVATQKVLRGHITRAKRGGRRGNN